MKLKNKIEFDFNCSDCSEEFNYLCDLEVIVKPVQKKYGDIITGSHSFKMGPLKNRSFYENEMKNKNKEEKYIADFVLHVSTYNDNDYTFEDMLHIIDELDIDIFEEIFKQWEDMRFKIDTDHIVKCPHCGYEELYEFDVLPGFFPDSWNIE